MTLESQYLKYLNNSNIIYNKLITSALMKLGTDASNAILSVKEATGIAGFVFQCPQEENIELVSDITDYYIENNTAVNDHIARKPVILTLHGLQGEYFYSNSLANRIKEHVASKLDFVQELLPRIQLAKNYINKYGRVVVKGINKEYWSSAKFKGEVAKDYLIQNGVDLFKEFQDTWKLGKSQTQAYLYFENLWRNQVVFSVDTSWKRFDNMCIQNIRIKRDNNADITDFIITCKMLHFVYSETVTPSQIAAGRTNNQKANVTNGGKTGGAPTSKKITDLEVVTGIK